MKRLWPILVIGIFFILLFKDFFFKGLIPVPADTLVGAYYPWLDYKWGYAVGVPVKNAFISDVFSTFFVWKHISTDILKHGIVPYWNFTSYAGTPLLATFHSTVLAPWNLFFLLPKYFGWGMYIFSSSLFACLSMYFYLSVLVKKPISRLVGALVFALSGPMTTWAQFGTAVWAAGCLPLSLLSLEMIITHKRPKYYLLLITSFIVLILSGHVQLLTYSGALLPIYAFFRSQKIKTLSLVIVSISLAVIACAIQLIPTADLYTRSIRSEEKYAQSFNYGLVPASQLIRLWSADFFGHPVTANSWGDYIYHEYSSFIGTIALSLVFAILFSKRSFTITFFSSLFLFSLFLATDNPISRAIFSLPLPLLTYSSASRIFFLTGLSAAVLVANFLDHPNWRRLVFSIFLFLFISAIAMFFVPNQFRSISLRNLLIPVSQLILVVIIIVFKRFKYLPLVVLLLIGLDLGRYYSKYNPFVPARLVFPQTPIIDFLKSRQGDFHIAREPTNLLPPNTWGMYNLNNVEGYDPLALQSYNRLFHKVNGQPYFDSAGRYSELTDFDPRYLTALNVRYLLAKEPENSQKISPFLRRVLVSGYPQVMSDGHVLVFQNPWASASAYFLTSITQVSSETELGQLLDTPSFDPTHQAAIFAPSNPGTGSGSLVSYTTSPNTIRITAMASSSAFLVTANSFDPGWHAEIDGFAAPIIRTNGALMGISFPSGAHSVYLYYLPQFMGAALALSAISWLAIVVLARKIV